VLSALARIIAGLCASLVFSLAGCTRIAQALYLYSYDRDIKSAARSIETARNDAQRAEGYAKRGRAYSEKARYSGAMKIIPAEEYDRLFDVALKDHDQSVALNPGNAEVYFKRGQTYYDRATVAPGKVDKPWLQKAAADFEKAVERNSRHSGAWDMLGLSREGLGELDQAIDAYTHEMALDRYGRTRLADAYCNRGSVNHREKKYDAAITDYEKSIDLGANADGCSCEPYNPLVGLYDGERHQYDKAWDVVHKAQKSKKWIAPELLVKLRKDSGRSD
jgi:tetratricopeptide (TPR) repeat protein